MRCTIKKRKLWQRSDITSHKVVVCRNSFTLKTFKYRMTTMWKISNHVQITWCISIQDITSSKRTTWPENNYIYKWPIVWMFFTDKSSLCFINNNASFWFFIGRKPYQLKVGTASSGRVMCIFVIYLVSTNSPDERSKGQMVGKVVLNILNGC